MSEMTPREIVNELEKHIDQFDHVIIEWQTQFLAYPAYCDALKAPEAY